MPLASLIMPVDTAILFFLNGSHTPFLDKLMWTITSPWTWLFVYIVTIWLLFRLLGKKAPRVIAVVIFGLIVSDVVSSRVIKPSVKRLRPTHNAELAGRLHIHRQEDGTYYYGGSYSFVSGHASTNTVLAMVLFHFIAPFYRHKRLLFCGSLTYVIGICLTRIYLGVHYPTDILCGILLGLVISAFCIYIDKKWQWDINMAAGPVGFYPPCGCGTVVWP